MILPIYLGYTPPCPSSKRVMCSLANGPPTRPWKLQKIRHENPLVPRPMQSVFLPLNYSWLTVRLIDWCCSAKKHAFKFLASGGGELMWV